MPWVAAASAWVALSLVTLVVYYSAVLPNPRSVEVLRQPPNLKILATDGQFIAERGMRRSFVTYGDISPNLIEAVVATEDRRFFYHAGFDPMGLLRASLSNWRSGEIIQGGSTITQQLAKNVFLRPQRTWGRKAEELALAIWLESRFTKREILELYLNRVYFGAGNYGIGAAAHFYFGKEARDITLAEAALLAGLIKAPSYYSPSANAARAKARARDILRILAETDRIDINRYAEALASPPQIKVPAAAPGFGYIADWVAEAAPMLAGVTDRNLIVETTIDPALQQAARSAVETVMRAKGRGLYASEAALVLLDPGGGVRALIGGRNHAESQFNRAVRAARQPGSAFKPFIYLAAVESGYTPDTTIDDSPVEIGDWHPENFGGTYRGKITLRSALEHSSNMAAVRLTQALGSDRVIDAAHRLGVLSVRDVGPTVALGTSEVTLLEMTSAFTVFGNGGLAVLPEVIERIRDDTGRVLFERVKSGRAPIVSPHAVGAMNDMMNAVVAGGTARGAVLPLYPAAGKTGTSQNFKDAWFIGYTASWTAGVWVGNDNAKPMHGVTGGSLPADIWKAVMTAAQEGLAVKALPGTDLDPDFAKATAVALGLGTMPKRNSVRTSGLDRGTRKTASRAGDAAGKANGVN